MQIIFAPKVSRVRNSQLEDLDDSNKGHIELRNLLVNEPEHITPHFLRLVEQKLQKFHHLVPTRSDLVNLWIA